MNNANVLNIEDIAIDFYMQQGYTKQDAVEKEKERCYCVLHLDDYGIEDRVAAFIVHLDNMGELKDIPRYLHRYIDFDKWYRDFIFDGGAVKRVRKSVYIITW